MSLKTGISRITAHVQNLWMGQPEHVIFFGRGFGDDLLCTAVARELKKRGAGKIVMFSRHAQLFEENPDFAAVYNYGYPTIGRRLHWGYSTIVPQYANYEATTDREFHFSSHFIATMCRMAHIQGKVDLRPYLHLRDREIEKGRLYPYQAVIQSAGLAMMKNKQWLPGRYQTVVNALDNVNWIQLGQAHDPPISGALDLRGCTTLRETAAIMASSKVFVGEAGFLMHLARATNTRSVIVYGGREDPAISGYCANENIVGKTTCSPCWQRTRCDFSHECMRMIEPEEVVAAVHRQMVREGTPLELKQVEIESTSAELNASPAATTIRTESES